MSQPPRPDSPRLGPPTYAGLFCITLATLVFEILLTRIFSVTLWYHFAFLAISIALFGTTVGALWVYLRPHRFPPERAQAQMARFALGFGATALAAVAIYLRIPISDPESLLRSPALIASYVLVSIPFLLSGVAVTLALTRFPARVGRLYAADLLGAATGCVVLVIVLEWTDAPTAAFAVAALACLGAWLCARDAGAEERGGLRGAALALTLLLGAGTVGHAALVEAGSPLLRILYARGEPEREHLYARWNSFSRVHVDGDPQHLSRPSGWGMSQRAPAFPKIPILYMGIDVTAGTSLIRYDGDPEKIRFLRYDVTNLVHYVRRGADVAVIGVGGGRDVLSALAFDQRSVLGVEVNENVLHATNEVFGDFTGHLDRDPRVTMVVDEARSHLARSDRRFDIIQISLIDTWAATAAGAFVLAESSLYTVEAWVTLLNRLRDDGVLSVSRWYFEARPGEFYRAVSLARAALDALGVEEPRRHLLAARVPRVEGLAGDLGNGVGTLLVSPSPFTSKDVPAFRRASERLGFEMVIDPEQTADPNYDRILAPGDPSEFYASFPLDLRAPTDDRPFFFQMLRLGDFITGAALGEHRLDLNQANLRAVQILGILVAVVIGLVVVCILLPLALTTERSTLRGSGPLLAFFTSIGLGFMFVEISLLQRLVVFLGHPTYALTVVLFTLLLAGGTGSFLSERVSSGRGGRLLLATLIGVLVAVGAGTPALVSAFAAATTPMRVGLAVALLTPMGLLMGTAFPLGMRAASARADALTPWLWGLNGAASVCCSVLAVAVSLAAGISVSFWAGVLCYVSALASYGLASRPAPGHAAS